MHIQLHATSGIIRSSHAISSFFCRTPSSAACSNLSMYMHSSSSTIQLHSLPDSYQSVPKSWSFVSMHHQHRSSYHDIHRHVHSASSSEHSRPVSSLGSPRPVHSPLFMLLYMQWPHKVVQDIHVLTLALETFVLYGYEPSRRYATYRKEDRQVIITGPL